MHRICCCPVELKGNVSTEYFKWPGSRCKQDVATNICDLTLTLVAVPNRYPNPTSYQVFLSIADPTWFSFENHQVAGNRKYQVLPDFLGIKVSGKTRNFGYSQTWLMICAKFQPTINVRKNWYLAHYLQKIEMIFNIPRITWKYPKIPNHTFRHSYPTQTWPAT